MHAHYLQHVPFEGLGAIGWWLEAAAAEVTRSALYAAEPLPDVAGLDLLVALGGPMSVNDEAAFPWLVEEKRYLRQAIDRGIPVLGVCLGAQLIASAMGARVYPNREKEIGWFPVTAVEPADGSSFRFPTAIEVFHWHGETFTLPAGAVHLARSAGCAHQAFQLGGSAIGLQFHLETTPASARALVDHCRGELLPGRFVQSEAQLLVPPAGRYAAIYALLGELLAYLVGAAR
ncbi:MAG: amidotransferase [Nitrospirae bacterium CG18_big_fil_WC_8_21_14_2_50_70_55]|nr:MAG: amidotransferase [Nitrospirae bacterium CG18_big_fil_WC_8_21_14_2_50_70_55]PIW83878.1 MAG: amidotransferase [Nitrospirae bacterium CG_4_8_14_3_um_filter_70_85]PIX82789.1 MAG: amidotransferase [Nitrospirae bacterium CG_4_10_14_3_um_filter_70_108]PJB94709.1 MAG: amidotransferase [Nitrospirae bacterium CG_4_9_14_0_8_um_filter_70_14]